VFNLLDAYFSYFSNPPQDAVHGQSTGQIMVLGPGIASLVLLVGTLVQKITNGGVVYMAGRVLILGGCIHNEGYLNGIALKPKLVLGPEIAQATASAIWAQNRRVN